LLLLCPNVVRTGTELASSKRIRFYIQGFLTYFATCLRLTSALSSTCRCFGLGRHCRPGFLLQRLSFFTTKSFCYRPCLAAHPTTHCSPVCNWSSHTLSAKPIPQRRLQISLCPWVHGSLESHSTLHFCDAFSLTALSCFFLFFSVSAGRITFLDETSPWLTSTGGTTSHRFITRFLAHFSLIAIAHCDRWVRDIFTRPTTNVRSVPMVERRHRDLSGWKLHQNSFTNWDHTNCGEFASSSSSNG